MKQLTFIPLDILFFSGEEPAPEPAKDEDRESIEREIYNTYNDKSPLMSGGRVDENEPEPQTEETAEDDGLTDFDRKPEWTRNTDADEGTAPLPPNEVPAEPLSAQPEPFRVINYGGKQIPVSSQEEYDRIAMAGIEAEHLKAQVTPYAPYIVALQQDPEFERHIASLIEARRRGEVPTEQPTAYEEDREPEQGDDETFDAYEKRVKEWNDQRQAKFVERNVRQVLERQAQNIQRQRLQATQQRLVEYTRNDPRMNEVLPALVNTPKALQDAMNQDPATFMVVYDTICRLQGREGYFGAPMLPGITTAQRGGDAVKQTPDGRTVLKERSVPFAEKGGVGGTARRASGLPDVKNMSESEFDKLLAKARSNGL